jgi:hypothetical protein
MKISFEIDFENEDDAREEVLSLLNARSWKSVAWAVDQKLRDIAKYSADPNKARHAQEIRDFLHEELNSHDLSLL